MLHALLFYFLQLCKMMAAPNMQVVGDVDGMVHVDGESSFLPNRRRTVTQLKITASHTHTHTHPGARVRARSGTVTEGVFSTVQICLPFWLSL